ncbi:Hypothetical predicted protein [Olea europaea subsp. europaea]|uniref:Uncharacterized protein n=1 Tax=Olea europaea subsp. europaea TaxID=158383 RepID=A0A8S0PVW8_OLEEU|nr:Hypothetical predicted protein [Olea europaea subsp. europaea]
MVVVVENGGSDCGDGDDDDGGSASNEARCRLDVDGVDRIGEAVVCAASF